MVCAMTNVDTAQCSTPRVVSKRDNLKSNVNQTH